MKVLLADDNPFYCRALGATLKEWDYEVVTAANGTAAWQILQGPQAPKLAILDWMMPGLDGTEVCRRVRALHNPEPTYILILTSKEGKENIVLALESGADDYITKPFDRAELRARLRVGRRIVGLQTSELVVFTFAQAVEAKSPYTHGHAGRVTAHALALADRLGIGSHDREVLRKGGLLHDIGKISIPDFILNKPDRLTPEEYEAIKQHPLQGVKMIEPLDSLREAIPLIRWHHERLDGRGYPDGLRGEAIPHLVRILSVADVYDAMASARPYRDALPHEVCVSELQADAARGGLDPELVRCFCEMPFNPAPTPLRIPGAAPFPLTTTAGPAFIAAAENQPA